MIVGTHNEIMRFVGSKKFCRALIVGLRLMNSTLPLEVATEVKTEADAEAEAAVESIASASLASSDGQVHF